jgi:hypothetical protein
MRRRGGDWERERWGREGEEQVKKGLRRKRGRTDGGKGWEEDR